MRFFVRAGAGEAHLQHRAARLVLELAEIAFKGPGGRKVKIEGKSFSRLDLYFHFFAATRVGHLQTEGGGEELTGAAVRLFLRARNRDRLLVTDEESKGCGPC